MSNSNFADSNRALIRIIKEANDDWGVTPVAGLTRELRYTSSSLKASKETVVSDEIRADRMVSSVIEVSASSGGDINTEFSAGSHDDFYEAFVLGAWTKAMTFDRFGGKQLAIAGAGSVTFTGKDISDYFVVGRRVKLEGFTNAANNTYATVTVSAFAAGVTTLTVTGATLVAEAGSTSSRILDANDVIVLKNTTVRAGTAGARAFDTNGGNGFASAIAAGQIVPGQRVFVEGLGFGAGSFAFSAAPADGDKVIVDDGNQSRTFQFGGTVATGVVNVGTAADEIEAADQLAAGIMAQYAIGNIEVRAISDGVSAVTLANLRGAGGTLSDDEAGAVITTVSFAGGDNTVRGFFTVVTAADDVLTVAEPVGTNANAGGLGVTIKGSMLRNPGDVEDITPQSFSIETYFTDVSQVFVEDGLRCGGFSMEVSSGAIVTESFTFEGRETKRRTSTLLGGAAYTPLESTATEVMNATTNVGELYKDGVVLSTAVQSVSLSGEANLRAQRAVSSKFARGIGTGRFNLTGSLNAYFETGDLYDDFIDHATVALAFNYADLDSNAYWFTLPALKFTSDDIAPGGIDQDVMEPLEFTAFRDPITECMLQIDRFSSTKAPTA